MTKRYAVRAMLASAGAWALMAGATQAQAQAAGELEEVIVTAQKREANLQDVPLSVTSVSSAAMDEGQIQNVDDLQVAVPGVTFGAFLGQAQLSIRGHGSEDLTVGGDPSTGMHIDGVYLGRPFLVTQDYFDVERVEILRGPQGTLFGRNNTGGSLNVISKRPTDAFEANGDVLLGNYDRVRLRSAVNLPLAPDLALRIAGALERRDGYLYNEPRDEHWEDADTRALRGILRWTPGDRTDVLLYGHYYRSDGTGPIRQFGFDQSAITGASPEPLSLRRTRNDEDEKAMLEVYGTTLEINYDLRPDLRLKSLSSYFHNIADYTSGVDSTDRPLQLSQRVDRAEQYSQEIQLVSDFSGRFNFVVGAFAYNELINLDLNFSRRATLNAMNQITGYSNIAVHQKVLTTAFAVFGEGYYNLTERLRLTLGARYSADEKVGKGQPLAGTVTRLKADWDGFTPRFGADYKINDDVMAYVMVSRGFKSGGMNVVPVFIPYDPETLWSYEVGIKSDLFDRRARLNISAFYDDLKDQQFIRSIPSERLGFIVDNAGQSTVYGVEVEGAFRITPNFRIDGNAAYLHAEFDEFFTDDPGTPAATTISLKGYTLPRSPRFTASVGAEYRHDLAGGASLTGRVQHSYSSKVYFTHFNELLRFGSQDSYGKTDLFLTYRTADGNWSAQAFVKNVADKDTISNGGRSQSQFAAFNDAAFFYAAPPRTFGLMVSFALKPE